MCRILTFDLPESAVLGIFEYRLGGKARFISSEETKVKKVRSTGVRFRESRDMDWQEMRWQEPPRRFRRELDTSEFSCSRGTSRMVLDDPADFFPTRGHALVRWRSEIEQLQKSHAYDYATDLSWTDANGRRFYLRRDACWEPRYKTKGNPRWQVLEFQDDRLTRVYHYDQHGRETIREALPEPSLREVLGEDPAASLDQVRQSAEYSVQVREKVESAYQKPYSAEVQEFLRRIDVIERVQEAIAANRESDLAERQEDAPLNLTLWAAFAAACGLAALLIFLLRRRRRRFVAQAQAKARKRAMGFDE